MSESMRTDMAGWQHEGKSLMAAVAGGAIVGMPLLYTMEMWFHGTVLSPWHQLAALAGMLVINCFFCLVSGFREYAGVGEAVLETVTAVGIGLVFSLVILLLIGAIDGSSSPAEISGKVLMQALAVSLGVSFADAHFRGKSRTGDEDEQEDNDAGDKPSADTAERLQLRADLRDISATAVGSILFALNIAPTEEVVLVGARLGAWQLLALLAAALVLCYVILYASGFEDQPVHVESMMQRPWAETIMTVALSTVCALVLLLIIGEREAVGTGAALIASTVTLALPATVGGAAGRLIT
jgi:putative integral membrane protein (TIGR02587 family)